jgi:hypothetical protein
LRRQAQKSISNLALSVIFYFSALLLQAQDPVVQQYGGLITPGDLKENLSIIASDALEGRETGKRGQKMAAAFISAHFEDLGLLPPVNNGYYQPFELYAPMPGECYVKTGDIRYENFLDVAYNGSSDSGGDISSKVIFIGKGREEDLKTVDVNGNAVALMMPRSETFNRDMIYQKGATMLFMVSPNPEDFATSSTQVKNFYSRYPLSLDKSELGAGKPGIFYISQTVAEKMFSTTMDKLRKAAEADPARSPLKKIKPATVVYKTAIKMRTVKTENVLGFLEGSDKKDEVVVVTAHYDHIGKRRSGDGDLINNGADDDGSGTVAVMQLAKVFARAKAEGKGPRRSILFMTVSAEEKGLFGSAYYTKNPVYPLDKTVVNLNIDMIGRRDAQHKDSIPYVYVIGADKLSTELQRVSESVNNTYTKLRFDYTYNDENHPDRLYYRSDHWNFAQNNIPIIFYFDGIHEDYHKVTDEVDKIEFDLLAQRTQCVFYTAWEIANRNDRIVPDNKKE